MTRRATKPRPAPDAVSAPPQARREAFKISDDVLARARALGRTAKSAKGALRGVNPFAPYIPAPGVLPSGQTKPQIAMDSAWGRSESWAGEGAGLDEAQVFLGYPELSLLAQRPEYRVISSAIAEEMTRKWIKLTAKGEDDDKADKIAEITAEFDRLNVRGVFREIAEQDGFFGRAHLYLDLGTTDDASELKTPIGDGSNKISRSKIAKGSLQRMRSVEAVWCYPANYNAIDPLKPTWYKPESWFVQGKEVHASRLLTFIGREVPDLMKPSYAFGGLSLSQMAKPYVDNWIRTRQSVADIVRAFSVFVLKTDLSTSLQSDGNELFKRADLFNLMRDNAGLMLLNKESEEFSNVAAPLAGLHELQAQSQEHMASVSKIPLVKLTGISPSGLNASSDGELRAFEDAIGGYQNALFRPNLTRVLGFVQLSLYGEVDPDIGFEFVSLYELSEKEKAEKRKTDAETGQILIDSGSITPAEERARIANDPETLYPGLEADEMPDLLDEEAEGLVVKGGGESEREAA